jgi:hypothetical protein
MLVKTLWTKDSFCGHSLETAAQLRLSGQQTQPSCGQQPAGHSTPGHESSNESFSDLKAKNNMSFLNAVEALFVLLLFRLRGSKSQRCQSRENKKGQLHFDNSCEWTLRSALNALEKTIIFTILD